MSLFHITHFSFWLTVGLVYKDLNYLPVILNTGLLEEAVPQKQYQILSVLILL